MIVLLAACTSWVGLEEISELPSTFPLEVRGEIGHITTNAAGVVAVDLAHPDDATAREAWNAMIVEAEGRGFTLVERGRTRKWERVTLEGPAGRLELGCCPRRADRQHLVLLSWRKDPGTGPAR